MTTGFDLDEIERLMGHGLVDRNHVAAMIAEIRELRAENARLREANGILEDGLQEVGDDYPGSSCQEWCQHQIKQARAALGEPQ